MLITRILDEKARGNPMMVGALKTKMILKGINVDKYTSFSDDDAAVLDKLKQLARDLGVTV